ncbi:hypothetical protein [Salegentibacter maritimus]|uniref:PH domain-containing protein n=1 Tax=Salegentibacter maritimus TaxID=2794347 RepID=A0ABS0TJ04_9FLAO|nr:hypothetical protein [Salegentibacter maritimus]MBI6120236.1 hypothetical protein [Salegentibacter maritimus]
MKIKFTRKRLKHYLIFGIIWLALGTTAFYFNPDNIFNYGYLIIGVLYFGTFLFENTKQYLTIENGTLTKHHLIPKKINLEEVKRIKKFAGDLTLISDSTHLKINTELIEEKSLAKLNYLLENLDIKQK